MADLKIADAPELTTIEGDEKIPTGNSGGNFSIVTDALAQFVKDSKDLQSGAEVDAAIDPVEMEIATHVADLANPHQVTKEQVGLGNVDNTADADKPISNAVQSAITTLTNGKADKTYVDSQLATKSDKLTTYTKTEVDAAISLKANQSTTYTKVEVDTKLSDKQEKLSIDGILTGTNSFSDVPNLDGLDGNPSSVMNLQAQALMNRTENLQYQSKTGLNYYDSPYSSSISGYPLHSRVVLNDGNEVVSTIPSNTNDPNIDMTGWVLKNLDNQIKTWSGRTQESKNKDYITTKDFGAICDGAYHPLSEKYGSLAAAQAVYPFATSLAQSIDDAALQKAIQSSYRNIRVVGKHCAYTLSEIDANYSVVLDRDYTQLFIEDITAHNNIKKWLEVSSNSCFVSINTSGNLLTIGNVITVTGTKNTICGNINNIYAAAYSCIAVSVKTHGNTILNINIDGVNALGNGVFGDGTGMCRGVAFDLVDPTEPSFVLGGSIKNVTGEEGDNITVVAKDSFGNYTNSHVKISKIHLSNTNRRMIKMQCKDVDIQNNIFTQDPSIVFTSIATIIDVAQGSKVTIRGNLFDGCVGMTHVSAQDDGLGLSDLSDISIRNNTVRGLFGKNHTANIFYIASTAGVKDHDVSENYIQSGIGRVMSTAGSAEVIFKDNTVRVEDSTELLFGQSNTLVKLYLIENTFTGGTRPQLCRSDRADSVIMLRNTNLTPSPMVRDNTGYRVVTSGNISTGLIGVGTGFNATQISYGGDVVIGAVNNQRPAQLVINTQNPATELGTLYVQKGTIAFSTNATSGQPIGYVAQETGAANAIAWKGFGVILT